MSKVQERNLKVGELLVKEGYLTLDAFKKSPGCPATKWQFFII